MARGTRWSSDEHAAAPAAVALPFGAFPIINRASFGTLGVCWYVLSFVLPLPFDVSLLVLSAIAAVVAASPPRERPPLPLRVLLPAFALFASTALSVAASHYPARGLALSIPLLPGALLLMTTVASFQTVGDTRRLYAAFSAVGLVVGAAVVITACVHPSLGPAALVEAIGLRALVVPNDATLLAVIAPLSLVLLLSKRGPAISVLAAASLLASATAIGILESRVAALTMIVALCCVRAPGRKRALLGAAMITTVVFVVDVARGFPLLHKFSATLNPRVALWITALAMFRDAPWFGHGPHTFGLQQGSYVSMLGLPRWVPVDDRAVPWAHNLYAEILAEQGLIGLLSLLALLMCALTLARGMASGAASDDERLLGAGALAAFVAIAVAALVELSFLREWVVVVTFTLFGALSTNYALRAPSRRYPS